MNDVTLAFSPQIAYKNLHTPLVQPKPSEANPKPDSFCQTPQQPTIYNRQMLQQQQQRPDRPYDPNKDATDLYQSMKGGFTGWGTDEAKLFKALEGKTPEQIKALRENYKDHYGRDLVQDILSELSGPELTRAQAMLSGNSAKAEAAALKEAMHGGITGLGTDEEAVYKALQGKTPEQRKAIAEAYKKEYGTDLRADIQSEFAGSELQRAEALLDGNQGKADAATLRHAMGTFSTDEDAIYKTLEGKSPEQRQAILDEYKKTYGVDLREKLQNDLSSTEFDRADALLDGDTARADAATIKEAMHGGWFGLGTDEDAINRALEGKSDEERQAIRESYAREYNADMRSDMRGDMSGNDLEKAETLLDKGKTSAAQDLKYAMEGWGTDEEAVKRALEGKSKAEILQIQQEYFQRTGRSLAPDLITELSGRDRFDAMQSMKGKPESAEEALQRMNENRNFERSNPIANLFTDTFNESGTRLDRNTARANVQYDVYQQALREGRFEDAQREKARLEQLMGYSSADVDHYRETKDGAAELAGTVLAAAGGGAFHLLKAPMIMQMLAAGAGTVAGNGLIQGQGYADEDVMRDFTVGTLEHGAGKIAKHAGIDVARRYGTDTVTREVADLVGANRLYHAGEDLTQRAIASEADKILAQHSKYIYRPMRDVTDKTVDNGLTQPFGHLTEEDTWVDHSQQDILI